MRSIALKVFGVAFCKKLQKKKSDKFVALFFISYRSLFLAEACRNDLVVELAGDKL